MTEYFVTKCKTLLKDVNVTASIIEQHIRNPVFYEMQKKNSELSEQVYEYLTENGEERVCDAISEEACKETPSNFLLNTINGFSSKFAEQLASPELIIPWIFSILGLPSFFSGLLVPVKNAGSLLPQLIVSAKIRAFPRRKYFWIGAASVQALVMLIIAFSLESLKDSTIGWVIVIGMLLFNVASGVASIAFKDVLGKTISKPNRGRLLAVRATGGGVLTILVGLFAYFFLSDHPNEAVFKWLFIGSAVLWAIAAFSFSFISEDKGATEGGRTPIQEIKQGASLLKRDIGFRNFLVVRGLLLSIPLVQPFLILYADDQLGISLSGIGFFMLVTGAANTISSPIWGKFADKSSKHLMMIGGIFGGVVSMMALLFSLIPADYQNIYTYGPILFLMIMAYGGARIGRKTYLVNYAPENDRPLYVSVANTFIGILVMLSALLSSISAYFGVEVMIAVLAGLMFSAAGIAVRLRKL